MHFVFGCLNAFFATPRAEILLNWDIIYFSLDESFIQNLPAQNNPYLMNNESVFYVEACR